MRPTLCSALPLAAALTCTLNACATSRLPAAVADAVQAELREGFGEHRADEVPSPRRLARPVDFNRDGVADWYIDYGRAHHAYWCGTGGCLQQLWISDGGRHVLAFDHQALGFRLSRDGSGRLDAELHGINCNRTGAEECPRSWRWDASQGRFEEIANRRGETLLSGPLFQPVRLTDEVLPPVVRDARRGLAERCRERRGRHVEYSFPVASVPDLDGDGLRDWIVDATLTECVVAGSDRDGLPADEPLRVFHSNGGAVREAPALPAVGYDIDIATHPATLQPRVPEAADAL